jgi:hypothetical protein
MTNAERCCEYRRRLKKRARDLFGNRCACGATEELQFAHVRPTGLCGMGRGLTHRYLDVLKHPKHYKLECRPCHLARDRGYPKDWDEVA